MTSKKKDRRVEAMEGMVAEGKKAADRMLAAKQRQDAKKSPSLGETRPETKQMAESIGGMTGMIRKDLKTAARKEAYMKPIKGAAKLTAGMAKGMAAGAKSGHESPIAKTWKKKK